VHFFYLIYTKLRLSTAKRVSLITIASLIIVVEIKMLLIAKIFIELIY